MNINPFLTKGYISPDYFCDRETETNRILSAIDNQRNLTLLSIRRMGKTGIILHVFNHLKSQKANLIYLDIYSTSTLQEFTTVFGNCVVKQLISPTEKFIHQIGSIFKGIRPSISLDPVSGVPNIDFKIQSDEEAINTLESIFTLLNESKKRNVIAIDEFQQITCYPDKNTEALLRSFIQNSINCSFIFSGSSKSILTSMFSDYNRPFYQSSEFMELLPIDSVKYIPFIIEKFSQGNIQIDKESVQYILTICKNHTFYVQFLCNRLFSSLTGIITETHINQMIEDIIAENEAMYFSYRSLLTEHQFKLLLAIANDDGIKKPNAIGFIKKYHLGSQSTVNSSLKSLLTKDLVYLAKDAYHVYDQYLSIWLKRKFKY